MKRISAGLLAAGLVAGCGSSTQPEMAVVPGEVRGGAPEAPSGLYGTDAAFAEVAELEPVFAGAYLESNRLVVVLTDTSRLDSAVQALAKVFGEERFQGNLPARAVQGTYTATQLTSWRRALKEVFQVPTVNQLGIGWVRNRVFIGVSDTSRDKDVEGAIASAAVPRDAVVVEVRAAIRPL